MQETQIYEIASRYTCTQATKYLNEPEQHYSPFLDWCRDDAKVEVVEEMMLDRSYILNLLFDTHCTPAEVTRLEKINGMLVIDRIAGNVENLLLEFDEFIFELDLVHRTIVGLFCVLFHAAKIRHEDAKEWQDKNSAKKSD